MISVSILCITGEKKTGALHSGRWRDILVHERRRGLHSFTTDVDMTNMITDIDAIDILNH